MDAVKVSSTDIKLRPVHMHPKGYPIDEDLFLQAVRAGKYRLVTQILHIHTEVDVNQVDSNGCTALLMSVQLEDYEVRNSLVKLLLRHNADGKLTDSGGLTPLMHACQSAEKVDTVRSLIKQPNCAINQQDKKGNTAVNWAAKNDNWRAIRVIVHSKFTRTAVKLLIKDSQGLSPMEHAITNGFTETCRVLLYEGKVDVSRFSDKYKAKLDTISLTFPEVYNKNLQDGNNNKPADIGSPTSPRVELAPLSLPHSSQPSPAMLTPIDGDTAYTSRKLPKLPSIANVNHS